MNLKKLESYLPVNLFGPGPRLMKKRSYRAAVSQRLRDTALYCPSPIVIEEGLRKVVEINTLGSGPEQKWGGGCTTGG